MSIQSAAMSFTCIACQVAFPSSDIQRKHYKTDWHRYNLKRKVADLPAVTAENFQTRVLAQRNAQNLEEAPEPQHTCALCKKHFSKKSTFEDHLKSKKHQEAALKNPDKSEQNEDLNAVTNQTEIQSAATGSKEEMDVEGSSDEEWEDVEEEALQMENCLFCGILSESLEANVKHMTNVHSFFIPDVEYLVDLEGLVAYLAEKISEGKLCLWCNETTKSFYTIKAVQQHMIDKGHCKVKFEGNSLAEYSDYYDYSTSYPDTDTADSSGLTEPEVLTDEDYELVLPSGASIGHRSLMKYYRQNIPPTREQSRKVVHKVLTHYRALGWSGATTDATARRARDVRYMQTVRAKHSMQLGVRQNKLQTHFRSQIYF